MQRDDREVRQVLVVEELRKALVQLRYPEVDDVLPARERIARALDEEQVFGVVVHVWHAEREFWKQPNGVDGHGKRDQQRERRVPDDQVIGEHGAQSAESIRHLTAHSAEGIVGYA